MPPSTDVQAVTPLVSVIINCYNGERYLREALDSVFNQTYVNWEIVFWDNASTDATPQIVLEYASDMRFRYYRAESNTPLGRARNLALQRAQGDYITFIDADDLFLPEAIGELVRLMGEGPYGLAYGGTIIIDESGRPLERRKILCRSGFALEQMLLRYEISIVGTMVRRATLEKLKLAFNEGLSYAEDYDLFMRIVAQSEIGVLPIYIVKNRRSRGSLTYRMLHLVAPEVGYTLGELERINPEAIQNHEHAFKQAKAKLSYYEAVNHINRGEFAAARTSMRRVIGMRWEYLVIYLALFLPLRPQWMLTVLKR